MPRQPWDRFRWLNAWVDSCSLSTGAVAVLAVLFRHFNEHGQWSISISTIAAKAGMSENTCRKHLKAAEDAGWIYRRDEPGCAPRWSARTPSESEPPQKLTPSKSEPPSESEGVPPQKLRGTPSKSEPIQNIYRTETDQTTTTVARAREGGSKTEDPIARLEEIRSLDDVTAFVSGLLEFYGHRTWGLGQIGTVRMYVLDKQGGDRSKARQYIESKLGEKAPVEGESPYSVAGLMGILKSDAEDYDGGIHKSERTKTPESIERRRPGNYHEDGYELDKSKNMHASKENW